MGFHTKLGVLQHPHPARCVGENVSHSRDPRDEKKTALLNATELP